MSFTGTVTVLNWKVTGLGSNKARLKKQPSKFLCYNVTTMYMPKIFSKQAEELWPSEMDNGKVSLHYTNNPLPNSVLASLNQLFKTLFELIKTEKGQRKCVNVRWEETQKHELPRMWLWVQCYKQLNPETDRDCETQLLESSQFIFPVWTWCWTWTEQMQL